MIRQGFETIAQEAIYDRIAAWLREIFGEFAFFPDDAPIVGVTFGSTFAMTSVYPWGENDAIVATYARVAEDVAFTPDLLYYLLKLNSDFNFGAFSIDENGVINFKHSLVGSTCDKEELRVSVKLTVQTADEYDDKIVARWGGKRAIDS